MYNWPLDGSANQQVPVTGVYYDQIPDYYPATMRARHGYLIKFPHATPPKLEIMIHQLSYGGTFFFQFIVNVDYFFPFLQISFCRLDRFCHSVWRPSFVCYFHVEQHLLDWYIYLFISILNFFLTMSNFSDSCGFLVWSRPWKILFRFWPTAPLCPRPPNDCFQPLSVLFLFFYFSTIWYIIKFKFRSDKYKTLNMFNMSNPLVESFVTITAPPATWSNFIPPVWANTPCTHFIL